MLVSLTEAQLDCTVPIAEDGTISVDRENLFGVLDDALGVVLTGLAITSVDYSKHEDGTREPDTRTVRGIAWVSLGENRCHKWNFRTDGRALSITSEGEQRCPISEDYDLVARAIVAIADSYAQSEIDERNNRLTATLPDGTIKKIRVVAIHDPRVVRPEDALDNDMELIAYRAGTLGVAFVLPQDNGQAIVKKMGC